MNSDTLKASFVNSNPIYGGFVLLFLHYPVFRSRKSQQAQSAYDTLKERMEALATVIHEAEDDIYADFCQRIGVDNIRQYEERQLKVAQEESLARLKFETQIARLTHQ